MIEAASKEDIDYFAEQVSYDPSVRAKGVVWKDERDILAMCLYDHWAYNSVQVHIYSKGPKYLLDKTFLREIFGFPFIQAERGILYSVTPADQEASLAVSKALGFVEVIRLKDGWKPGIDWVVKEMRKENCRWLDDQQKAA